MTGRIRRPALVRRRELAYAQHARLAVEHRGLQLAPQRLDEAAVDAARVLPPRRHRTQEVTLALTDWDLASEARARSLSLERLDARSVAFTLERGRRVLATARGRGVAACGVIRTRLESADVAEVVAAVTGGGELVVRARVEHAGVEAAAFEQLSCALSSLVVGKNDAVAMLVDGKPLVERRLARGTRP